jgi:hypothetical protein
MIVDCHCHAGKGDGLTGPWDTRAPLGKYIHRPAHAGIDHTVLFAANWLQVLERFSFACKAYVTGKRQPSQGSRGLCRTSDRKPL